LPDCAEQKARACLYGLSAVSFVCAASIAATIPLATGSAPQRVPHQPSVDLALVEPVDTHRLRSAELDMLER